jgi:hypothetical protein
MAKRNGNGNGAGARAYPFRVKEREERERGDRGGDFYYVNQEEDFLSDNPNKYSLEKYQDFEGALMSMLLQSAPRELKDAVNSACHIARIAPKTAYENYLLRLTSSSGPLMIYKEQNAKVIDFRRESRNGHTLHRPRN